MLRPDSPTVVVRCDVGSSYGVGHLMRCVALAEEFAARGFAVVFAADVTSVPFAQAQLDSRGFAYVDPPRSIDDHLALLADFEPSVVVIDSYVLPAGVYSAVRSAYPTLALVDGSPEGRTADVLVDQNIGAEDDHWPLPEGATRLAGLSYALMRDEILGRRPDSPGHPAAEPPGVFAFFGGTDAFGAAPLLTKALLATGLVFDLRVVGATDELRAELEELAAADAGPASVTVLEPTSTLAAEVSAADLVVCAAGTSSWEVLCLGAACAFVCVADNQRASYERVSGLGVVAGLGDLAGLRAEPAAVVPTLRRLLTEPLERDRLRAAGWRLVDGRGRARVADAVLSRHVG